MPQNHRTFLYLSDESIAHLPSVHPLYFISFFLPLALCQLSPPPFHLSPPLSSVRANPLPLHFFSSSPHPSQFLTSRSGPFPSLIDMFPFSKLHSLHHICSFADGYFSFAVFHSLLHHALGVHLTPVPYPWWALFHPAIHSPDRHGCPCQGC